VVFPNPWMPHAWDVTATRSLSLDALTTLKFIVGATATPMNRKMIPIAMSFFVSIISSLGYHKVCMQEASRNSLRGE